MPVNGEPNETSDVQTDEVVSAVPEQRARLNRRTVLKGAAHAAWAVPAVQIVTAVPAFAASPVMALTFTAATAAWQGQSGKITVNLTVRNPDVEPAKNMVVTLTFPANVATPISSTGWAVSGRVATQTIATIAAGTSQSLSATFESGAKRSGSGSVQFTAHAADFAPDAVASDAL